MVSVYVYIPTLPINKKISFIASIKIKYKVTS